MHPRTHSLRACLVALAMGPGCYTGLSDGSAQGEADEVGTAAGSDDAGDDEGGSDDDGTGVDACAAPEVGATPLTRLTRAEYDHTIVDLLGIDGHPASALPPDGVSGLFANNGQTAVSNYAVEVYRDLAESLAEQATADLGALLPCDPAVTGERECAQAFVEQFGRRAYRRDLDAAQRDRLLAIYDLGRDDGSFDEGISLVLEAVLQSPLFLYRIETGVPELGEEVVALDDFELATRLSYFLWKSMPDDALLDAAAAGTLKGDIETHARRMLEDPRAERALLTFYGDLFALDTVTSIYKDPERFPQFSAELADDMRTELELFVLSALRDGDARLETLLGGSHTFVNAQLAELYGIEAPACDEFARVELDPSRYRGLLSKPVVMTLASRDQATSPTVRGKIVRTRMFCQDLPPPPPGVETSLDTTGLSTREKVQQRLDNPSCAGCHEKMDPIGLAFESFDAIGRYRTDEDGVTVDASGALSGTDVDGDIVGVPALVDKLIASDEVGACASQQWFEFALGRKPGSADACTNDALQQEFSGSDHDIVELMVAITTSPAFRTRRPDA